MGQFSNNPAICSAQQFTLLHSMQVLKALICMPLKPHLSGPGPLRTGKRHAEGPTGGGSKLQGWQKQPRHAFRSGQTVCGKKEDQPTRRTAAAAMWSPWLTMRTWKGGQGYSTGKLTATLSSTPLSCQQLLVQGQAPPITTPASVVPAAPNENSPSTGSPTKYPPSAGDLTPQGPDKPNRGLTSRRWMDELRDTSCRSLAYTGIQIQVKQNIQAT